MRTADLPATGGPELVPGSSSGCQCVRHASARWRTDACMLLEQHCRTLNQINKVRAQLEASPGGEGDHAVETDAGTDEHAAAIIGEGACDHDHPDADKHAAPDACNPSASCGLGPPDTNSDGTALRTRCDCESTSEEEF